MNNNLYRAPQCTGERKKEDTHKHMSTPQHHSPTHNSLNGLEIITQSVTCLHSTLQIKSESLERASHLVAVMLPWKDSWERERAAIGSLIQCSAGHALLSAASVCYLARAPPQLHRRLWDSWVGYCCGRVAIGSLQEPLASQHVYLSHRPEVDVLEDFSVVGILSDKMERLYWEQQQSFPNSVTLERCLAARSVMQSKLNHWPLVFDPYQLFQHYASALAQPSRRSTSNISVRSQQSSSTSHSNTGCVSVLRTSVKGWAEALSESFENVTTAVLILDQATLSSEDRNLLEDLLKKKSISQQFVNVDPVDSQLRFGPRRTSNSLK